VSTYLDFEKPIAQIAQRATDYRAAGDDAGARHAEGAPRRLNGRMASSTAPGLGVKPKLDVLGKPVLTVV